MSIIFAREEAGAIMAYLEQKRDSAEQETASKHIDAALDLFWRERARAGPEARALKAYIKAQGEYLEVAKRDRNQPKAPCWERLFGRRPGGFKQNSKSTVCS
jgi:hypothetical protein